MSLQYITVGWVEERNPTTFNPGVGFRLRSTQPTTLFLVPRLHRTIFNPGVGFRLRSTQPTAFNPGFLVPRLCLGTLLVRLCLHLKGTGTLYADFNPWRACGLCVSLCETFRPIAQHSSELSQKIFPKLLTLLLTLVILQIVT